MMGVEVTSEAITAELNLRGEGEAGGEGGVSGRRGMLLLVIWY
jgi:hypothetical protein